MVLSAALIGALGGSLVLSLKAVAAFALGMAVGAAIAAFACSRWPGLSANWECLGATTGWSSLFTDLGPMLCGLCLVPPSIGLVARWWAARPKAQSIQLESAGRIVPPATRIACARESDQMEPRAVPSDRIPLYRPRRFGLTYAV
jgi:hypothetical protein